MLLNLKLTNFRKIVSDEMTFTDGVNCIRGANEASKSTRLEAIGYALFGSRALRTPIEQVVTYGCDVKKLKVELSVQIGNQTYVFTRSKNGAEVVVDGTPHVTGQTEVSLFAASLLGADVNIASKLMFANQGDLRGALTGGPKYLAEMIS